MRAIIQQIQENIFALPLPITPEAVLRIFSTYNNNLATLTLDTGFEGVCTELNVISQLAIEGQQLIDKRLDLTKTQEEHVRHAQLQIKLLEEKIELEHSIQTINVELNALFANLLPLINVLFLLKNPNKPPYASTDEIEKQCALVLDHNERLTRQLVANELPAIKLNLVRLKYRKTALLKEVNDLGLVHHGGGKLAWFKEVTVALTDEIAKYTELRPKLEQLQKKFANQLSEDDLQTKIGELQRRSLLLGKELQQLTERIKTNSLTPDIKLRLEDEFRKSTDINGLLSVYESKIDTIYSYVDLTSWISWLNDDYNKKQAEFKDSWHFLKLLLEQRNIQKETTDLSSQLQSLEQLLGVNGTPTANREFESYSTIPVPETGDSAKTDSSVSASLKDITAQGTLDDTILDNTETTQKSLIEEARQLINAIPSFINTQGLDLTSQASDFYLALLENIPLISQKIDKKTIILEKLKALVIVMTEIEQIREKYKLPEPSDNQLPSLEQLEREIPREEDKVKTQAEIARQKLLCSGYLDKARKLPILLKELRKTKCSLIAIPVELSKYTVPLDQQICALSSKLALLITDIEKKIAGMKSSSTSNMTKNIDSIAEVLVKVESPKGTTTVDTNLQQDDDTRLLLEMTITGDDGLIHPTHNPLVSYGTGESVIIEPIDDTVEHGGEQAKVTTLATDTTMAVISTSQDDITKAEIGLQAAASVTLEQQLDPLLKATNASSVQSQLYTEAGQLDTHSLDVASELTTPKKDKDSALSIELDPLHTSATMDVLIDPLKTLGESVLTTQTTVLATTTGVAASEKVEVTNLVATLPHHIPIIAETGANPIKDIEVQDPLQNALFGEKTPSPTASSVVTKVDIDTPKTTLSEHVETTTTKPIVVPNQAERIKLQEWHLFITNSLTQYPEEIKSWYLSVYNLAIEASQITPFSYKYVHVIKDIFFELQHNNCFNTIESYWKMCPNPVENIKRLLSLKPNSPLSEGELDEDTELLFLPSQLQAIYAHYKKLKNKHPIEADLLLQAMKSLNVTQKEPRETILTATIPMITEDPRYDPLKRHRGFLKIWELLEDFCRLLVAKITGKPAYEQTQKHCFFKTESARLIEEADLFITRKAAAASA